MTDFTFLWRESDSLCKIASTPENSTVVRRYRVDLVEKWSHTEDKNRMGWVFTEQLGNDNGGLCCFREISLILEEE